MNESGIYSGGLEAFRPRVNRKAFLAPKVHHSCRDNVQDILELESGDHRCMRASLIGGFSVCSRSLMIVLTTTQAFLLAAAGFFQPFDSVVFNSLI